MSKNKTEQYGVTAQELADNISKAMKEFFKKNKILEPKKLKMRFYPNGACFDELEEGQEYYCPFLNLPNWETKVEKANWDNHELDRIRLKKQEVFLTKEACQRYIEVEAKHKEIRDKIMELNFDEGWEADWSDFRQDKYYINYHTYGKEIVVYHTDNSQSLNIPMSKKTRDKTLEMYSQEELKMFLKLPKVYKLK